MISCFDDYRLLSSAPRFTRSAAAERAAITDTIPTQPNLHRVHSSRLSSRRPGSPVWSSVRGYR
jgi:hypothetical protein